MHFGGKSGAAVRHGLNIQSSIPDGSPEDIASWVSYICKPEAHYITGMVSILNRSVPQFLTGPTPRNGFDYRFWG